MDTKNSTVPFHEENTNYPKSATYNLTSDITGQGVNQTVRTYMKNQSRTMDNENGYFEIPAPADNMYLDSGDFIFEFNNNYTTEYIIEDDSALNPSSSFFEQYGFVRDDSSAIVKEGIGEVGKGIDDLTSSSSTFWNITSSANGIVNLTICANFSDASPSIDLPFNRSNIGGFNLDFEFNLNKSVDVTVYMKWLNSTSKIWKNVTTTFRYNHTQGPFNIEDLKIINENLGFINESDCVLFQFLFDRSGELDKIFNVTVNEFNVYAFVLLELPITNDNWIALEFDLKGYNSTVNGFHAWIRTLDLDLARFGHLNITLYRANDTINSDNKNNLARTNLLIEPDLYQLLDSIQLDFNSYHDDDLTYFEFDTANTNNLNGSIYYIVIKSNVSSGVYSLVTLHTGGYGDNEVDHQIEISEDNGNSWNIARSKLNTRALNTIYLDAHLFKLNVTRAYMPSDFEIDTQKTLQVENEEYLNNFKIEYSDSPNLEWGFGIWNYSFANPIKINALNNFRVNLTWNMTYIKGFKFDVNYTAIAYRVENATTYYNANYDYDPEWVFNYTLDLDKFNAYKWNFTQLWFIYPNYYTAHNLTTPGGTEIFPQTSESLMPNMPGYLRVIVSTSIINTSLSERTEYNGTYSLYLTGFNAIKDSGMHSYINYKGILWESNGFMFGDNISIRADIQGPNNLAPKSGFVNVSLYYPNGTLINNLEYTNGNLSKDETLLFYDFNHQTIYNITQDIPVQGTYYLGYFWTNDSIVGCNKIPIYIDSYELVLENCTFDNIADKYLLAGTVQLNNSKGYPYDAQMLIGIVNETTGKYNPGFYPVNTSISIDDGIFTYTKDYTGYEFDVYLNNFMQNETILNPEEEIQIKATIQNRDLFGYDLDVRIEVKLVSYQNEEWIIDSSTSITHNLKSFGQSGDTKTFSVNLTVPSIENDLTWDGINAPIRQGGVKTILDVYIEDNHAGTYVSDEYSLLIPEKEETYEGYIIALKKPGSSRAILQYFEKDKCTYLPENCTFVANVINKDYISIYHSVNLTIGLKSPTKFWNITINPETPIEGKTFIISANLATEFDISLSNKKVYCQYYDGDSWINITSGLTGPNGYINLKIDSSLKQINAEVSKLFRLVWFGDTITLNGSQNLDIDIIVQTNSIRLSSEEDESFIYTNTISIIKVGLRNTGNSILQILEIDIEIDENSVDYEIKGEDNTILDRLISGESTTITIELDAGDIDSDELDVEITITAQNIVSGEIIIAHMTIDLDVAHKPLFDYFIGYFMYFILAFIALIGVITVFYYRSTKKKLEKQVKEVEKKRPRRGKYVKVSELKLEPPEVKEKEEDIEELEAKKTVDLDELLEEELEAEEEPIEKAEESPVEHPPEKVELQLPPKKVIKEPKKKKKPKKGRISTRQMVEQKKKKKKRLKITKKDKKSKPKKALRKKKEEPKKAKPKKTADLDSLLEEEGLDDKK